MCDINGRNSELRLNFFNSLLSCFLSLASKLDKGSSSTRIFGFITSALAMATRCCWPPDNSDTFLKSCSSFKSTFFANFPNLFIYFIFFIFFNFEVQMLIFSYTFIVGNKCIALKYHPYFTVFYRSIVYSLSIN